jgi:hypothetical protein
VRQGKGKRWFKDRRERENGRDTEWGSGGKGRKRRVSSRKKRGPGKGKGELGVPKRK